MANDDNPRGLFPLIQGNKTLDVRYFIANTAADIYLGMPVDLGSDGLVAPIGVNTAGAVKTIGVVVDYLVNDGGAQTDPYVDVSDYGNDTIKLAVCVDPLQEYVIQEDTGGTALVQADAGTVATLIFRTTSGNTNTGWTNLEIDRSTIVANGSGQVQLMRLQEIINTDGTQNGGGNYGKWIVRLLGNRYQLNAAVIADPAV